MNGPFAALTRHFWGRFFDTDATAPQADPLRAFLQFIAILAMPGLVISFFLMTDYWRVTDPIDKQWARTGDRYVFVSYAMIVVGLVMTYKWESLFPDRQDYLILTSLPISMRRWFAAKVTALIAFLCLLIAAINLFSLLITPAVRATSASVWAQVLLAHAAGALGGSIFMAVGFAALQGLLINLLPPRTFRRISPWIQMASLVILVILLLVMPFIKASIRGWAETAGFELRYLPFFWFLGLYEYLLPGGTLLTESRSLAQAGIIGLGVVIVVFAVSYYMGYRRYARKVLETADSAVIVPTLWRTGVAAVLNKTILRNPFERAAFYFTGQITARSARHRLATVLYLAIGVALAITSFLRVDLLGALRIVQRGVTEAPLILSFLLVAGLRSTFNIPCELGANWIFQTGEGTPAQYLRGVRKWIFLCRILPLQVVLVVFEFWIFPPWQAGRYLVFDLVVGAVLVEAVFFNFRKIPFTCSRFPGKLQLGVVALGYLYGFTLYVNITAGIKRSMAADTGRMIWFLGFMAVIFVALALYRRRTGTRRLIYEESDPAIYELKLT